ncbi:hypothetical protein G5C63_19680 [Stenotrophomonas pavanii]|uniref:hypothetical protein n=1 Tax=Stenotrophomonas pavanii TaxID=487698 RepID=UPI0013DFA3B6|nr:hypothetical protein [Stenotrophomonas pavanii]NGM56529.1 hypothetical protein [Stenotrophomonas pavanii]
MADQLLTAAMEDRMTWKPISSAPRDGGKQFLAYDSFGFVAVCMFIDGALCVAWDGSPFTDAEIWHPIPELGDAEFLPNQTAHAIRELTKETDDGR